MKRVVALFTNYWTENGKISSKIAIHKDSIYHVIREYHDLREQVIRGIVRNGLTLYELLETPGIHDEAIFKEIPDDFFEDEMVEEQIEELILNK